MSKILPSFNSTTTAIFMEQYINKCKCTQTLPWACTRAASYNILFVLFSLRLCHYLMIKIMCCSENLDGKLFVSHSILLICGNGGASQLQFSVLHQ